MGSTGVKRILDISLSKGCEDRPWKLRDQSVGEPSPLTSTHEWPLLLVTALFPFPFPLPLFVVLVFLRERGWSKSSAVRSAAVADFLGSGLEAESGATYTMLLERDGESLLCLVRDRAVLSVRVVTRPAMVEVDSWNRKPQARRARSSPTPSHPALSTRCRSNGRPRPRQISIDPNLACPTDRCRESRPPRHSDRPRPWDTQGRYPGHPNGQLHAILKDHRVDNRIMLLPIRRYPLKSRA